MSKELKLIHANQAIKLINNFCDVNSIPKPKITLIEYKGDCRGSYSVVYKDIKVWLHSCSHIGKGGPAWSYPGYVIDATPYGVICHEFGHYLDFASNNTLSKDLFYLCKEHPVTGYNPNKQEFFAEHFRVFITNPDFYKNFRPKSYQFLIKKFTPVITESWEQVLSSAPARTIAMARKKLLNSN